MKDSVQLVGAPQTGGVEFAVLANAIVETGR